MKQLRFVNREEETNYLKKYFLSIPNALLFLFGPKSSGKSTLIVEVMKELNNNLAFFYYDLREYGITNYLDFVDIFFKESKEKTVKVHVGLDLKVLNLGISKEEKEDLKDKRTLKNALELAKERLMDVQKRGKIPVFIIDELQMLRGVYLNDGRTILDSLFNFFVTITKMKHIAHVLVCTSDSLFIEDVYDNSALKKTSQFYLVDELRKDDVEKWLSEEGYSTKDIKKIYSTVGGEPWYLQELLKSDKALTDMLSILLRDNREYLKFYLGHKRERMKEFESFLKYFIKSDSIHYDKNKMDLDIMYDLVRQEILSYNPVDGTIKPQSRLMLHAIREVVK